MCASRCKLRWTVASCIWIQPHDVAKVVPDVPECVLSGVAGLQRSSWNRFSSSRWPRSPMLHALRLCVGSSQHHIEVARPFVDAGVQAAVL